MSSSSSLLLVWLCLGLSAWFSVPVQASYDFKCNLHCYNEGECRHGKGKFGAYAGVEDEDVMPWEAEGPQSPGMYCACPIGYTGLQCEIKMNICGNDEHTCFNGSSCAKERAADGTTWWRCECDVANSVMDASYAGRYCEHIATVFCNKNVNDFGNDSTSYCTNGGKCKEKDHEGQKHVGCICLEGFEGEHCEIDTTAGKYTWNEIAAVATSERSFLFIMGMVALGVSAVLGVTWYLDRRDKKQRRRIRRGRLQNAEIQSSFRSNRNAEMA